MKIAVCFKIVSDYSRLSASDWAWDDHHQVDTRFVRRIFNCYEESALEIALALRETAIKESGPTELTAITVDDRQGDLFLKHLAAVGYDRLVRIQVDAGIDLRFNPVAISDLISAYIKSAGHQLVFLGQQGAEGDNLQTGFLLAERLKWPCIRDVSAVVRSGASALEVSSRIDGGTLVQSVRPPAVLIAGHCPDTPYLRVPTLKQKLNAKTKPITHLSSEQLGFDDQNLIDSEKALVELMRPPVRSSCVFLEGGDSREQARQLYDRYLKEVLAP